MSVVRSNLCRLKTGGRPHLSPRKRTMDVVLLHFFVQLFLLFLLIFTFPIFSDILCCFLLFFMCFILVVVLYRLLCVCFLHVCRRCVVGVVRCVCVIQHLVVCMFLYVSLCCTLLHSLRLKYIICSCIILLYIVYFVSSYTLL